jgi:hypothetical protein
MIEYHRPEKTYTAPFQFMGTSDYAPYPLHTPLLHSNSNSNRRRSNISHHSRIPRPRANTQSSTSSSATITRSPRCTRHNHLAKLHSRPRHERVDSGFEDQSDASSITFTDEVERRFELLEFLRAQHNDSREAQFENEEEEEESDETVELSIGELGRRARDSIDINIWRAESWESKEKRTKNYGRNLEHKLRVARKWVRRLMGPRRHA